MGNNGYVSKQNMGGSEKVFSGNKCDYKVLPKADGLKEFKQPNGSEKGPMQHKAMKPTAPRFNS
jgi:hypothetical protein